MSDAITAEDTMTTPRMRAAIEALPERKAGAQGVGQRMAANESPEGPLPSVLEAVHTAATELNHYPDYHCTEVTGEIAKWLGVGADNVVVGAGAVGVTQMVFSAVSEPGSDVIYPWRSFEAYPTIAALAEMRPVAVPLREDGGHDLDEMAAAITPRTRLILVCNPNNPTGVPVHADELSAFLDRVPADCLVLLDEAYREYVRDPDVPDGLHVAARRPNVAVLRTFSKAYGLAALRVGYLAGDERVVSAVRKARLGFSVNGPAQAAVIASLLAEDELLGRVEHTIKERDRVRSALLEQGWRVARSEANFLWLRTPDAVGLAKACAAGGLLVRAFDGEGVRVSIATPQANDAFLGICAAYRDAR